MTENESRLKCTILGSFRFKREIDLVREELEDNGVQVLGPEKGTIFSPPARRQILIAEEADRFKPMRSERNIPIKVIEDGFLRCIANSDFVYLVDVEGYLGQVVSMEMGAAIAWGIPVYAQAPVDESLETDPMWRQEMRTRIKVMSASDATAVFRAELAEADGVEVGKGAGGGGGGCAGDAGEN